MSRKYGHQLNVKCTHEGCKEFGHWNYDTLREYRVGYERHRKYKCVRHNHPEELLSNENTIRQVVITCERKDGHNYWRENGKEYLSSGFLSGPGWKAYASDFEPGTSIVLTAEVVRESITNIDIQLP